MDIRFDPVKHVYTNSYTQEEYMSATRFLHHFKPEFDSKTAATRVSLREGCSVQDILDRWKEENNKSKDYGTGIHQVLEKYMVEGSYEPEDASVVKAFKKVFSLRKKDGIEIEKLTYLHEYKIAGTADIIAPEGEYFDVFDMKTNKKFNFASKYNEYMLAPLRHLPACEYTIYSLQISLYAYAYHIMTGRKFRKAAVFYWDRETESFTSIPIMYMKREIEQLLSKRKYELEN